jgi:hypothetical protein
MAKERAATREAKHGQKMIEVSVRFWTDDLSSGVVRVQANKAHGITSSRPKTFNSLLDLGKAIEQTLLDNGIVLHMSRSMKRYTSVP